MRCDSSRASPPGDLAYETGYFRSTQRLADGSTRVRYTRFEMILRKERGRWRILLDKDSAEGAMTEQDYLAAAAMTTDSADVP